MVAKHDRTGTAGVERHTHQTQSYYWRGPETHTQVNHCSHWSVTKTYWCSLAKVGILSWLQMKHTVMEILTKQLLSPWTSERTRLLYNRFIFKDFRIVFFILYYYFIIIIIVCLIFNLNNTVNSLIIYLTSAWSLPLQSMPMIHPGQVNSSARRQTTVTHLRA